VTRRGVAAFASSAPAPAARAELYALIRIGQGHLAAATGHQGIVEAEMLGDETVTTTIAEDPDLHDHIAKGLYEAKLEA